MLVLVTRGTCRISSRFITARVVLCKDIDKETVRRVQTRDKRDVTTGEGFTSSLYPTI